MAIFWWGWCERSIGTEGTLFSKPHEGMLELPCTAWRAPSPPVQPIGLREVLKPPHLMGKTGETMVIPCYTMVFCVLSIQWFPAWWLVEVSPTSPKNSRMSFETIGKYFAPDPFWQASASDISGAATGPFSPQKSIPGLGRCDEERVLRHPAGSSIGRPAIRKRRGLVKGTHTQKKGLRKKARRCSIL